MYNMVCYKYLSYYSPDEEISYEVDNSNEMQNAYATMTNISNIFKEYNLNIDDANDILTLYNYLINLFTVNIKNYNVKPGTKSYLWIDEILPVRVTNNNVKILSINNSFSTHKELEELNTIISNCVALLSEQGGYNSSNFDDIIFLIFLDIIPKKEPTFVVYPDDLDEDGFFDDEYND